MPESDGDYPWSGGDDLFSWLWLGSLLLVLLAGAGASVYLVATGQIMVDLALTGTIDVGSFISSTLRPVFWVITLLAIIEIYGATRVRSLLDNWGGGRDE